jgi:hypothetical protein
VLICPPLWQNEGERIHCLEGIIPMMRKIRNPLRILSVTVAATLTASLLSAQVPAPEGRAGKPLTASEKDLLEYLRLDWTKQYRTTSFSVAAQATGRKLSDASRLKLARALEASRKGYTAPARHGVTTVALSPQEKWIARAILAHELQSGQAATAPQIAQHLNALPGSLKQPLRFLLDFGAIAMEGSPKEPAYRVAPQYPRRPSYKIDFYSHQVEVNGQEKFEVA